MTQPFNKHANNAATHPAFLSVWEIEAYYGESYIVQGVSFRTFQKALTVVCQVLAKAIVKDGEGATRFITLHITGAPTAAAARQVGMTIATSPLVKTAYYGADANWGRILAAAGRAGVPLQADHLKLWIAAGEDAQNDPDVGLCSIK